MTPVEFAAYVRFRTRTNSTNFTDAQILTLMKVRQDEIAAAILKTDEDILLLPQYVNLVADQREYPQPADLLSRMKRLEAKLDGSNWLVLSEIDITKITTPIADEADITANFSNEQNNCFFDILRKSIVIYSGTITSVTNGLRMYLNTFPAAITDLSTGGDMSIDPSDTTHGIPRELHKIWATGVVIDYKSSREKPIPLTEREANYELDLQKAIETLKHGNLDREVIADIPNTDGSEY